MSNVPLWVIIHVVQKENKQLFTYGNIQDYNFSYVWISSEETQDIWLIIFCWLCGIFFRTTSKNLIPLYSDVSDCFLSCFNMYQLQAVSAAVAKIMQSIARENKESSLQKQNHGIGIV